MNASLQTHETPTPAAQPKGHWSLADLDFSRIDVQRVRGDETLFYLACSASFVESGSDLYTRNLVDYFEGDEEVTAWLRDKWEHEELQHGSTLRAYVEYVWPEFPWEAAYKDFLTDYAEMCKVELLCPTRGLELSARCVVETGTSTYYKALAQAIDEPVFRQLSLLIAADEVNHFKYFYKYFRIYREKECLSRWKILKVLVRRTWEFKSEDADCAIRNILRHHDAARANDQAHIKRISSQLSQIVSRNLNSNSVLKMLMRPLELPPKVQAAVQAPIELLLQKVVLR